MADIRTKPPEDVHAPPARVVLPPNDIRRKRPPALSFLLRMDTLRRLSRGEPWWLALGMLLQVLSVAGYVAVFRAVFACDACRLGWRASYQITMAGDIAGEFFAAAGAGGPAAGRVVVFCAPWRAGLPSP